MLPPQLAHTMARPAAPVIDDDTLTTAAQAVMTHRVDRRRRARSRRWHESCDDHRPLHGRELPRPGDHVEVTRGGSGGPGIAAAALRGTGRAREAGLPRAPNRLRPRR